MDEKFYIIHFYVIVRSIMFHLNRGSIFIIILLSLALSTGFIYVAAPYKLFSEEIIKKTEEKVAPLPYMGKSVIINLNSMTVELRNNGEMIANLPIISKGKPGSYYETPGGKYENDYKEINHFSSIGHVFMPFSVHIFGNFFIHGIPYYPDGTKVSSTYSGGCVRLSDENAETVYNFIEKGNPIIITQNSSDDFEKINDTSNAIESMEMTRYMSAIISLEFLTQDNEIYFNEGTTTRRKLLYNLLSLKEDSVSKSYASYFGKELFIKSMNAKANSIGLNNTLFLSTDLPAKTTDEDVVIFNKYIRDYKSYLLN